MRALLGYNRKLAWVTLPVIVWACLGLAFALGAVPGAPPFALYLGLPPGGLIVPGRLLLLEETSNGLHLQTGVPEWEVDKLKDWPAHLPFDVPNNISVEFTALNPGGAGFPPETEFKLQNEQREVRQLPNERQLAVTQNYIVLVLPFETHLLPRAEATEKRLRQLLDARPHWRPRPLDGDLPRDEQEGQDKRQRSWFNRSGKDNQEATPPSPPGDQPGPPGEQGPPPEAEGPPPELGPPPEGAPPEGGPPEGTPPEGQPPTGPPPAGVSQ